MTSHTIRNAFSRIALAAALACVLAADVALGQTYITLSTGSSVSWNTTLWTGGAGGVPPQTSTQVGLFNGGGTVTISDTSTATTPGGLLIGWGGGGNFTMDVTSGTLTISNPTVNESTGVGTLTLGESGGGQTGTLNQSGGLVVAPYVRVRAGTGVYNLNSGTLQTTRIASLGIGPMTFNFGGGTLEATGTSITGLTGDSGISMVVGAGGGTVNNGGFATLMNAPISGTGNLTLAGGGTTTYTANNTHSGTTTLSAGTLRIGNSGTTGNLTGPLVNNAAVIFARSDNATYTSVISGSGTLTKQGSGTLVIGPSNTYTGLTTIASGTLQSGNFSLAGIVGGSYDVATNAKLAFSRNVDNVSFGSQSISGAGDVEFQAQVAGYYAFRGTYTGTLSYSGQTIVNLTTSTSAQWFQNTLWLEKDNVLPSATVVNLQSGKIYNRSQTGTGISVAGLTGNAGTFITTDQGIQKWTVTVAADTSHTYAGVIGADGTGTGNDNLSFTKAGAGTQIFTGSNSYTGGTFVTSGTLQIGAGGTSGQIAGNVSVTGGSLVFDRSNDITFAGDISGTGSAGTVIKRNATTLTLPGSVPFTGSLNVEAGSLKFTGTGNSITVNSLITGSGALVRDASANAAGSFLVLNGSSNYSGGTTINAGFVQLGTNNALGTGPLVFTASTDRGSLNLQGFNQTVAGLTASNTTQFRGDIYNNNDNALSTLTIDTPTGQTFTYANQIGSLAGWSKIALVKAGAGTQILSGNSLYFGTTAVNAGKLLVNGDNSLATGAVTVAAGAVLGGAGTIGGATTISGTLSPGSSPGVLTIASLVLNGPSTSLFELDGTGRGTGYDGVTITQSGGLTYGGVLSLAFSGTFATNTTFDLFNFSGTPLGSFSSVTASGPYGSLTFTNSGSGVWTSGSTNVAGQTMTFSQSTGDLVIVPEPGALALAGLGIAAAAWARRRRK